MHTFINNKCWKQMTERCDDKQRRIDWAVELRLNGRSQEYKVEVRYGGQSEDRRPEGSHFFMLNNFLTSLVKEIGVSDLGI
jgi:hypothetical protein